METVTKDEIRRRVLAARKALPQAEQFKASFAVAERFMELPFAETAKTVGLYSPLLHKGEVDARILHRFLRGTGVTKIDYNKTRAEQPNEGTDIRIAYPKTEGDRCHYYSVLGLFELKPGRFGVNEPITEPAPSLGKLGYPEPANPEVIVVPGIAFDRFGNRIGFGHGFFDRTIKAMNPRPIVVGLAYDLQVVGPIQRELWDEPIDFLVTETEIITMKESN